MKAGDEPRRPQVAASIACFRDGRVLIARRGRGANAGLWSLPGGGVEFGEAAADAAVRELLEETGACAEVLGLADMVEVFGRDADGAVERHALILAFAGRWLSGEPGPSEEASEVAWVEPDALAGFETTPGLADVVRKAARMAS